MARACAISGIRDIADNGLKARGPRGRHHRVDIDIASGVERQQIAAPAHGIVDIHITIGASGTSSRSDQNTAGRQRGAELRSGRIAARGRDGEIGGIDQPGARCAMR